MSELSMLDIMICEDLDVLERDLYTDDMYVEAAANRGGGSRSDNKIVKLFDTIIQKFKDLCIKIKELIQSATFKAKKGVQVQVKKSVLAADDATQKAVKEIQKAKTEIEVERAKKKFKETLKRAALVTGGIVLAAGAAYALIDKRAKNNIACLEKERGQYWMAEQEAAKRAVANLVQRGESKENIERWSRVKKHVIAANDDAYKKAIFNQYNVRDRKLFKIKAAAICSVSGVGIKLLVDENNAIGRFLKKHKEQVQPIADVTKGAASVAVNYGILS